MQTNINPSLPVLTDLIDQATNYIISQNYSASAIEQHIGIWRHLQEFADSHGYRIFSMELSSQIRSDSTGE